MSRRTRGPPYLEGLMPGHRSFPAHETCIEGVFRLTRLGLRRSFRFGLALCLCDGLGVKTLRQLGAPCSAIPLLEGLRRDRALDQQLGKLPSLRFALDWH